MTTLELGTEVTQEGESIVRVTRNFNAPRELVWHAYVTPELVQRWLPGPSGWSMPVCEMDVRAGGTFRLWWKQQDGDGEFGFHGAYREVESPSRIVSTEFFEQGQSDADNSQGSLVTFTLTEHDGVTTMTSLIDFYTKEAREAAVAIGMTDGFDECYQRLENLLETTG